MLPVRTLKELCCWNIIKHEVMWELLPNTLVKEIEHMELNLMFAFNGRFSFVENYAGSELAISWRAGEWHFNILNQETIRIVAGINNYLGKKGGALFLFPHRHVIISDFHIDINRRELKFVGRCSSAKDVLGRHLVSTLMYGNFGRMMTMKTVLTSWKTVVVKKKERRFIKSKSCWDLRGSSVFSSGSGGESDSSIE